jgi:formate dehydrogenase beta subunit
MKALLAEGWDAVFVGCGAPRGRDLDLPGRQEAAAHIHIGIDWLASVSFGHVTQVGKRVIVLGGGNTAMDCCRSARRLGGEDVKVIVRSGFEEMKASPWEKEDAQHEGIPSSTTTCPRPSCTRAALHRHDLRDRARRVRRQGPAQPGAHRRAGRLLRLRRGAGGRRPGKRLPLDRARLRHRLRPMGPAGAGRATRTSPRCRTCSSAATRPSGPRTSSPPWPTGTRRRCRSTGCSTARPGPAPAAHDQPDVPEDGHPRVELRQRHLATTCASRCPGPRPKALASIKVEVELGFDAATAFKEAQRCLNCDVQTVFTESGLHRVRCLRGHLPDGLHHLHRQWRRGRAAHAAEGARDSTRRRTLYVSARSRPGA